MTNHLNIDAVFHALADPTRRAVIEQLSKKPAAIKELAAPYHMALPSFLQHIKILEQGGLIETQKIGRTRQCSLRPEALQAVDQWIRDRSAMWTHRMDALDQYLQSQSNNKNPT